MTHDITDTLRTQEQMYRQMGNERQGDVLRAARKEIELLREEVRLLREAVDVKMAQPGAELPRSKPSVGGNMEDYAAEVDRIKEKVNALRESIARETA
jgi:hypothetical protein